MYSFFTSVLRCPLTGQQWLRFLTCCRLSTFFTQVPYLPQATDEGEELPVPDGCVIVPDKAFSRLCLLIPCTPPTVCHYHKPRQQALYSRLLSSPVGRWLVITHGLHVTCTDPRHPAHTPSTAWPPFTTRRETVPGAQCFTLPHKAPQPVKSV